MITIWLIGLLTIPVVVGILWGFWDQLQEEHVAVGLAAIVLSLIPVAGIALLIMGVFVLLIIAVTYVAVWLKNKY